VQGVLTIFAALVVLNIEALNWSFWPELVNSVVGITGILIGFIGILQAFKGGGWGAGLLGVLSLIFGAYVLGNAIIPLGFLFWNVGLVAILGGIASIVLAIRVFTADSEQRKELSRRNPLIGVFRILAISAVMLIGIAVVFVAWLLPVERQGIRIHSWVITWICRIINWLLRIKVVCDDQEKLIELHGIAFVNHVSFLDIPVVISILPMRFLSTSEVFHVPFFGWVADSIATVFVDRSDKSSRRNVRESIAKSVTEHPYPPFVIFPEGRFGTATSLRPFHYGSFDVAALNSVTYLPCALRYDRPDIAIWRGVKEESFFEASLRVLTFRGKMQATVTPLEPVHPTPEDDAAQLAHAAQRSIETRLGFEPAATDLEPVQSNSNSTDRAESH
jgi:1-acyl-sn-glycerol-3-phosphate acyltransferase